MWVDVDLKARSRKVSTQCSTHVLKLLSLSQFSCRRQVLLRNKVVYTHPAQINVDQIQTSCFTPCSQVGENLHSIVTCFPNSRLYQTNWIHTTQTWKQPSGDPSGQTWNYRGIMLLYNFTTALLYMVSSVTMARIVAVLLNNY